jgi:hypothetical protein
VRRAQRNSAERHERSRLRAVEGGRRSPAGALTLTRMVEETGIRCEDCSFDAWESGDIDGLRLAADRLTELHRQTDAYALSNIETYRD